MEIRFAHMYFIHIKWLRSPALGWKPQILMLLNGDIDIFIDRERVCRIYNWQFTIFSQFIMNKLSNRFIRKDGKIGEQIITL